MTMPGGFEAWASAFSHSPVPARDPRADTNRAFARLVELSGATAAEFAETLSLALGRPIRAELIDAWSQPAGPTPPTHWFVVAAQLVERARPGAAAAVLGGLAG